jgi:pimeloyl-ACP methyl ester carboxylesterase
MPATRRPLACDRTAKTTIISGGADKPTPMWHARELADGIPGATLIHRQTAGHTLLHEVPQVATGAISSAIAAAYEPGASAI